MSHDLLDAPLAGGVAIQGLGLTDAAEELLRFPPLVFEDCQEVSCGYPGHVRLVVRLILDGIGTGDGRQDHAPSYPGGGRVRSPWEPRGVPLENSDARAPNDS